MPPTTEQLNRLEQLLQAYFEGTMSDDEGLELLALLDNRPKLEYYAQANFNIATSLDFLASLQRTPFHYEVPGNSSVLLNAPFSLFKKEDVPSFETLDMDELFRLAAASPALPAKKPQEETSAPQARYKKPANVDRGIDRFMKVLLACTIPAVLLLGVFMIYREFNPVLPISVANTPILARVEAVADPIFRPEAKTFKKGQKVAAESIELDSGWIELRLESGVRIVLEGPAAFDLRSAMKTFCRSGRLSAEVPPQAKGFEVQTPQMNIYDLGTEFVVDVSEDECAVHVIKGEVELDRFSSDRTSLSAGVGMVARSGNVLKQFMADARLFIPRPRMQEAADRYEAKCFEAWSRRRETLAADPDLLLHFDFMEKRFDARSRIMSSPTESVQMKGCRIVPGRWAGSGAVSFDDKTDVLQFSVPKTCDSFTMVASVCPEDLSRAGNALLSLGDAGLGAMHWQINRLGELQLLLGDRGKNDLMHYPSPPVFSKRDLDAWFYVAVVVDAAAKTVTHYVDDKPIVVLSRKASTAFDFSRIELGNWLPRDRSPTDRHFHGKIDEFILLGRAVTEDEMKALVKHDNAETP